MIVGGARVVEAWEFGWELGCEFGCSSAVVPKWEAFQNGKWVLKGVK
jgi:hypothetical protein